MKQISSEQIVNAKIIDPRDFDYDEEYRKFLDFFGKEYMGRNDVTAGIILDCGGKYVLGYISVDDVGEENYAIGDGKGNYLTLDDCSKFLRKFNRSDDREQMSEIFKTFKKSLGVKPQNINDMEEEQNIKSASNLLILDVPREVLNWYNDVKKKDIVPFDILAKAVRQWVDKAILEKNEAALGKALMKLYDEYGINASKVKGSWKKYKG